MYKKGDYIVYGSNGPCLVVDVTRLSIPGCDKKRKYYVLRPVNSDRSMIYSPVDNDKVTIREVMSKEEAEKVLAEIPEIDQITVKSEKFREEQYKDIIKGSDVKECIGMMKALISKRKKRISQGRKFTTVDERYLRETNDILSNELSIALGQDKETAEALLREKMA